MTKKLIKSLARLLGIDIRRARPRPRSGQYPSEVDPHHEMMRFLGAEKAHNIIDVGAHTGESALAFRKSFPRANIHAFEPFPASYKTLLERTKHDRNIYPSPLALSSVAGTASLNVNKSAATNSLLRTDERAFETWNRSDVTSTLGVVTVPVSTLDSFCAQRNISEIDLLKLDAQGAEYDIISGARDLITRGAIRLIYTEIIIMPSYQGQAQFDETLLVLREGNFILHNLYNYCYTNEGRVNQLDAIFVRSDLARTN